MAADSNQWLVITDLDGTFLDHHDYSYAACMPTLNKLSANKIPVIFNTSKTYRETIELQHELGITAPFIVENGSAIFFPRQDFPDKPVDNANLRDDYWQVITGESIKSIHRLTGDTLEQVKGLVRLSQCTAEQASELTGLTQAQAANAISREFSEPLMMEDNQAFDRSLISMIEQAGLTTLQGGRFLHVLGNSDKGKALKTLVSVYDSPVKTIALGDSANDAAMLKEADISIVVKSPGNKPLLQQLTPSTITTSTAPEGWAEGVDYALQQIQKEQAS